MIGLGSYPAVTLAHARQKAIDNARAIAQGRDPRVKISTMPTFEEAAKVVMELNAPTWKDGGRSAQVWASSLTRYAYPVIGNKPVSEVTTADLMAVLTPIWTNKMETAKRLRTRMGQVFKWAIGKGYRSDNPAGEALLAAMPRQVKVVEHRKALAHAEVSRCLETIRQSGAWPGTKFSFELLTLTATRSGEVRGATWGEIDLEAQTWNIPAERMKAGKAHSVPLSSAAMKVLREAEAISDTSGLVFPSSTGRMLSDSTLSKLVRENDCGCNPHGMRSSFRDWSAESGVSREVAEECLAHHVGGVEAAYRRSDMLDLRREVMEAWGRYVS